MKTELGYKYSIQIETITPVAIGNGEQISPLSDYWLAEKSGKQYAYLLDKEKWEKKMLEDPGQYFDTYQRQMKLELSETKKKHQFLSSFIQNVYKSDPASFTLGKPIEVYGNNNPVALKRCIQEANQLLIPGSSLKGAIKSAILYGWLIRKDRENSMRKIVQKLNSRDVKKEYLEPELDALINQCLNSQSAERKDFSVFRVEDTYFDSAVRPVWYHCKRFRIKSEDNKNKRVLPVFLEAIPERVISTSHLFVEHNQNLQNTNEYLNQYFNTNSILQLFDDINEYALDNIDYEEKSVYLEEKNNRYLDNLDRLREMIKNSKQATCFLPVGFGKTNFYQSIGLALCRWIPKIAEKDKRKYEYSFQNYLSCFKIGKRGQKNFPVTRTLIDKKQQPLGWVKLTLNNK